MGLLNLSRVCVAVLFASAITPALAADPPVTRGNVSVTVNPTTGYYSSTSSTVRLPSGVSTSPTAGGLPVVSRYSGGLQQQIPMGITIDAIKKSAPLPVAVRSTTQSVKGAATRCLTSARCNVGLMLAGAGLQQLFNALDWVMDDAGRIQEKPSKPDYYEGVPDGYERSSWQSVYNTGKNVCPPVSGLVCVGFTGPTYDNYKSYYCSPEGLTGAFNDRCYYGGTVPDLPPPEPVFVSNSDIESGVDSEYVPEPSDWPALTSQLELDGVEITSAPTLKGEPITTTVYDADGNPHEITETNIWYDFDIRDNGSSSPALDMKTREETKNYKNGALTGTTTTESSSSAGSGGGGAQPPEIDIPTDCDFMPTVCAFLDWFKDDNLGDEPDLKSIMKDDEDFEKTKTISFGSAVCPAPHTIHIPSLGMSVDLSFDFFCQFAIYAKALVLAAAYIFAAYISLGVARG